MRDLGHADDFDEAQWLMLLAEQPEDFVIATDVQHPVRAFVTRAALELGIALEWKGNGAEEIGVVAEAPADSAVKPGQRVAAIDPR